MQGQRVLTCYPRSLDFQNVPTSRRSACPFCVSDLNILTKRTYVLSEQFVWAQWPIKICIAVFPVKISCHTRRSKRTLICSTQNGHSQCPCKPYMVACLRQSDWECSGGEQQLWTCSDTFRFWGRNDGWGKEHMGKTVPQASSFGDRWRIADCCKDGGQPERRGDVPDDGTAYG